MPKVTINPLFEIGQTVYLKTDPDQLPRIVFCYMVFESGGLIYKLAHGTGTSEHYDFEISFEVDVLLKTSR